MPRRPPLTRYHRTTQRRAGPVAVTGALAALALVSCSAGSPPVAVSPPAAAPGQVGPCRQLHAALPSTLGDTHHRRAVTPDSAYTAAWGDPAIVLLCGVAPPTPPLIGDELVVDGHRWLAEHSGDQVVWHTLGGAASVELDVPAGYDDQDAIVADVSSALPGAGRSPSPAVSGG